MSRKLEMLVYPLVPEFHPRLLSQSPLLWLPAIKGDRRDASECERNEGRPALEGLTA